MSFGTFCANDDPGLLGTWMPRLLGDAIGVAAAGNLQSSRPYFPAALPGIIGVGGLDRGGPAWFTNRGSWVDACAPAVNVVSTFFHDVTEKLDGQPAAALPGVGAVERHELRRPEGRRGDRPGDVRQQGRCSRGVAPAVVDGAPADAGPRRRRQLLIAFPGHAGRAVMPAAPSCRMRTSPGDER